MTVEHWYLQHDRPGKKQGAETAEGVCSNPKLVFDVRLIPREHGPAQERAAGMKCLECGARMVFVVLGNYLVLTPFTGAERIDRPAATDSEIKNVFNQEKWDE